MCVLLLIGALHALANEGHDGDASFCVHEAREDRATFFGFGAGDSSFAAGLAARADARRRAREALCGALATRSPWCEARMKSVQDVYEDARRATPALLGHTTFEACAAVHAPHTARSSTAAATTVFEHSLASLAEALGRSGPVHLDGRRRTDGCSAGPIADAIRSAIADDLALAPRDEATATLRLRLAFSSTEAVLAADSAQDGGPWQRLYTTVWPADWFDETSRRGRCFDDHQLGEPGGRRPGAAGLEVALKLTPASDTYCEGADASVSMDVDRPAMVRLLEVVDGGDATQLWPHDGQAGQIEPGQPIRFTTTLYADGPSSPQRRLVAAAVPSDDAESPLHKAREACVLPGGLTADALPPTVAIDSVSLRIDRDPERCPRTPVLEDDLARHARWRDQLPRCW